LKRLTTTPDYEGEPSFSPDGSKIVFVSERKDSSHGKIFIMNADGSNQKQLTFDRHYDFAPSFSPDGEEIIFVRERERYYTDIFIMNAGGSNLRRLTYDEMPNGNPYFSRDGKKIRYSAYNSKTKKTEIHEITINDSKSALISKLEGDAYQEAFSPDEKKIVFVSSRMTDYMSDSITKTEIYLINSDGTALKQLTDTESYKESPKFSPNGKKIIFLSLEKDGKGKGQIMIMNIDGSALRIITNNY
jgi:TolB protein